MAAITEFLEARIAEDERNNDADVDPVEWCDRVAGTHYEHARIGAECAAKRAVIKSYLSCQYADASTDIAKEFGVKLTVSGMVKGLELAVKHLAAVYANHPDYQDAWAL